MGEGKWGEELGIFFLLQKIDFSNFFFSVFVGWKKICRTTLVLGNN